jgi:hypothetical protein
MSRYLAALITLVVTPNILLAAPNNFAELMGEGSKILNQIVPVILGLMILVFFWGLSQVFFKGGDPKAIDAAKKIMWAGILGFFVALSVWGLVGVLLNTVFGTESIENRPPFPEKRLPTGISPN